MRRTPSKYDVGADHASLTDHCVMIDDDCQGVVTEMRSGTDLSATRNPCAVDQSDQGIH